MGAALCGRTASACGPAPIGDSIFFSPLERWLRGTVGGGPLPNGRLESVRVCGRIVFQPPAATLVGSRMIGLVSQEPREPAGRWVLGPLSHMRAMRSRFWLGRVLAPALGAASRSEP